MFLRTLASDQRNQSRNCQTNRNGPFPCPPLLNLPVPRLERWRNQMPQKKLSRIFLLGKLTQGPTPFHIMWIHNEGEHHSDKSPGTGHRFCMESVSFPPPFFPLLWTALKTRLAVTRPTTHRQCSCKRQVDFCLEANTNPTVYP